MKLQIFILLLLIFAGISCSKQLPDSMYIQLSPSTFTDELIVEGEVKAVNSVTINGPSMYSGTVIVSLVEAGTYVKVGDTVCIVENKNIENNYETMLTRVDNTRAKYNKTKANLELKYAMLRAELESIDAQTAITNLDSAQMNYLSPVQRKIKELQLKQAKITRNKIQQKFDYLKPINDAELRTISLQIKRDSIQSLTYKNMLDNFILTSPINGMVMLEQSPTSGDGSKVKIGDNSYYGYPILSIPDKSEVKVIIMVAEADYRRVSVGDSVIYSFEGMHDNKAWGKIKAIEPMGQPIARNSKVKEFKVTASVDSFSVIPEPGLSANCRIILENIADTIVVPQLAIFEEDSLKVVYTCNGNRYTKQEVALGAASLKHAVVIAGLKGDEKLSFIKPADSKIRGEVLLDDSVRNKLNPVKLNDSLTIPKTGTDISLSENITSKSINH